MPISELQEYTTREKTKNSVFSWIKSNYILLLICLFIIMIFWVWIDTGGFSHGISSGKSITVEILEYQYYLSDAKITFRTYNEGFFSARNVEVLVSVINQTGNIIASNTVFVGTIKGGDSKTTTINMKLSEIPQKSTVSIKVL